MLVVVLGVASLPEVQDVENVPSYAEWVVEPEYVALRVRADAIIIVHSPVHQDRYSLPFNPSATKFMLGYRPELSTINGNALVVGIRQGQLTDCPLDIRQRYEDHQTDDSTS